MPRSAAARNPSVRQVHGSTQALRAWLVPPLTALALALGGGSAFAQGTTVIVPANVEWFDTGIDVRASNLSPLRISASGSWTNVPNGQLVGASGYGSLKLANAVAPTEPFGSLIGKVNGTIFAIGERFSRKSPGDGRLFLAMNDVPGTYGDNSGQLTVVVIQELSKAASTFDDPVLTLELLSADPTPFFEPPSFRWRLRNRTRPPVNGELRILLDGVLASADPAVPSVSALASNSELSGTFLLFTGAPAYLSPGEHTVTLELRSYTSDHALVSQAQRVVSAVVPSPPPSIAIASFKATPNYQNQGSESQLSWTLQPTSTCKATDLVLAKKDYGQPEVTILQTSTPDASGSKSVVVAGGSSPLRYTLSVACKYCSSCQTLANTRVTAEVQVSFPAAPPAPAPYLIVNGPFTSPIQVRAKKAFSVSWTVENLGGAESASFDVELFLDGVKEGDSKSIPKLDAGKSTNVTWSITKELASGIHQLELKRAGSSIGFSQFQIIP
jgi:hypothetical protein